MSQHSYCKKSANQPGFLTNKILKVFLPVYNRGRMTGLFIAHLLDLLGHDLSIQINLLDDKSTDDTVQYARSVFPGLKVIPLSGSAYWGGALNMIQVIVASEMPSEQQNSIYMVCNDDIRIQSSDSLVNAIINIKPGIVAFARTIPTSVKLDTEEIKSDIGSNQNLELMSRFDPNLCQFLDTNDPQKVNVAPTRVMIALADAWLCCKTIPRQIPHYLSDYWLTYSLYCQGYKILYPSGLICYNYTLTSRNFADASSSPSRNFISNMLKQLSSSSDPLSPSYLPAWMAFFSKHATPPAPQVLLIKWRLKYMIGLLVRRLLLTLE